MSTSVSSVVSHFPSAENGFTTTLASTISSGAVTVPLNSVAGYSDGEIAVFVVDPTDANKKQTFTGTIDTAGVQVTSVVWTAGANQTHSGGATVVDYATATHISMMTKGLLVEHTQAGRHVMTSPKVITDISDTNGNELLKVTATASAVNEVTLANAAAGNNPTITASGDDTNVGLSFVPKGSGVPSGFTNFKVGTFTGNSTTGTQAVTGVGFTPKFLEISQSTDNATTSHYSRGVTDGTSQWVLAVNGRDSASNHGSYEATDKILAIIGVAGSVIATAVLTSFDSDGFTIDWDNATASTFYYVAYG